VVAEVGGKTVEGLRSSYREAGENAPLLIVGSRGYLEIAVNRAVADRVLGAGKGAEVKLRLAGLPGEPRR
jgi:S-adenosylmethionine hydrolase